VRAQSITATVAYTYTADGLRVAQAVAGAVTTYAWDWAQAVPELLQTCNLQSAICNLYLIGHETLGWWDGTTWAYILPDGLGSVRQAADAAGAVVRVREWTPYGEEVGGWWGGLGYTGEWQDAAVGLVYLRARWYAPGVGRFTQPDLYRNVRSTADLHLYVYVRNNPVVFADPSGLVPPPPFPAPWPTIGEIVDYAEWLYRKDGLIQCTTKPDSQSPFDTAWDLFVDFVCEYGPEHRHFGSHDYLTLELAQSALVHMLRLRFYLGGGQPLSGEMRFNVGEFLLAWVDYLAFASGSQQRGHVPVNITHFLGSWDRYEVALSEPGKLKFVITNRTDRSSGSHIPGRFPPEYNWYLDTLVQQSPELASAPAIPFILAYSVVSVLSPKSRAETVDPEGGGTMWQTFTWEERYPVLGCSGLMPWPNVLQFLVIE